MDLLLGQMKLYFMACVCILQQEYDKQLSDGVAVPEIYQCEHYKETRAVLDAINVLRRYRREEPLNLRDELAGKVSKERKSL